MDGGKPVAYARYVDVGLSATTYHTWQTGRARSPARGLGFRPGDIPILARSFQREILCRIVTGPVGRLRHAVQVGTQTNRVSTVIRWLRDHFDQPIRIEALADIAGLGEPTLHHHFRALMMSPLQYQKHLRLHEARRLMIADRLDASSAALRVGYERVT